VFDILLLLLSLLLFGIGAVSGCSVGAICGKGAGID
jgi:hypothetical protein